MQYDIDTVNELLDEIAAELPEGVFDRLNGGVSLLDEVKRNRDDSSGNLYTLGEYRHDQMGRYIVIYYGSIRAVYGNAPRPKLRKHLRDILTHELTHHVESLAGDRELEIKDKIKLTKYKQQRDT